MNYVQMKKSITTARRYFLILGLSWISIIGNSQVIKSNQKERKELREAEMMMNYKAIGASLEAKKFLLEMEYILEESGTSKKLNRVLNYIMIDTSRCVWQNEFTDINTDLFRKVSKVEGSIDGWKLVKDNKRSYYFLQFKMFTDNGIFYISLSINSDKTISGKIDGVRDSFAFMGRIVTL